MTDVGSRIKALRQEKGLTQEGLAEQLFLTRQTISNYESNRTQPDLEMLGHIAATLDVELADLLSGSTSLRHKEAARQLIFSMAAFLVFLLLDHLLSPLLSLLQGRWYSLIPISALLWSAAAFSLGWSFLHAVSLFRNLKTPDPAWASYVRCALIAALALNFFLLFSACLYSAFTISLLIAGEKHVVQALPPMVSVLSGAALALNLRCPLIFLLLGCAARFLGIGSKT